MAALSVLNTVHPITWWGASRKYPGVSFFFCISSCDITCRPPAWAYPFFDDTAIQSTWSVVTSVSIIFIKKKPNKWIIKASTEWPAQEYSDYNDERSIRLPSGQTWNLQKLANINIIHSLQSRMLPIMEKKIYLPLLSPNPYSICKIPKFPIFHSKPLCQLLSFKSTQKTWEVIDGLDTTCK